jgi:hypothetical protein
MEKIELFEPNDKVKHPKFGTGTVMFRTGEGECQKVTVKFGAEVGEKKLLAKFAQLKRISERPTIGGEMGVTAVPGRNRLSYDEKDSATDFSAEKEEVEEVDDEEAEDVEDEDEE